MTPTQRNSLRYVYREEEMTMMTVNEVSKLTGVSIRTLQYYDTIGLLKPIEYTESGYRLYDDTSLERLQQILLFKELEFPLKRKCDAQEWERAFKLKENLSLDMYFEDFVDLYLNDIKSRIKYNTWLTKKHIVEKKILPYFSKKKLQEIKPSDIRQWQNNMMNYRNKQGEGYSQVYLKTIHNQLSAILNHAVNFYDLKSNPARKAGSMGKERTKEMLFWTKEEYMKFIEAVADKPISFYGSG